VEPTAVQLRQPWESEYGGQDAVGRHVIALWSFTQGAEVEDASGHKHMLRLAGGKINPDGRFGSCLESFRGHPFEDRQHAAIAKNHPDLTPKGAFTVEMWIRPKPELNGYGQSFLLDKKYVSDNDYQLILSEANKSGRRTLRMSLGFGTTSEDYLSTPFKMEPNAWCHIAFTYDGAGTGAFYIDGTSMGKTHRAGRKGIQSGGHFLSIGDRIGSYYHGFPGFIDQVRIADGALEFRRVDLALRSDRSVFVRMEKVPPLRLAVTNLDREALAAVELELGIEGTPGRRLPLPKLDSGQTHVVDYEPDTTLRPDSYKFTARLTLPGPKPCENTESFALRIVPRPPPHRFPVLMWGVYTPQNVVKEIDRLKRIGFTHVLGLGADMGKIWKEGNACAPGDPETVAETKRALDLALANDMTLVAGLSPGSFLRGVDKYLRVNRAGKTYERKDICGLFPEIVTFCRNVGVSVSQAYSGFPAFQGALIHTEVRDDAQACFHEHDLAAYRRHAGADIPKEVTGKLGVHHEQIKEVLPSRVIPDDHPIYRYYQWFWKEGDGWNALNTAVHKGLKSAGRADFWTFHDPAVRVASVYGSGGGVDVLSHWTYTYPDPIRIAIATDELLAMAAGSSPPQGVMKMTQIIWYREQTAPRAKPGATTHPAVPPARWELDQPEAPFITIAPMHLREAFWTKIARPIRGIMYHGWQSLVPCEPGGGYCFTNPQTQEELAGLIHRVVKPLGPMLLQVPGVKSDVAFLESFAAQVFAQRGTYGWGRGWGADAYLVMLYAHLQPEIVYDETITTRGLEGFRVLVMCDCDVITQAMLDRIKAFQQKGGLIIGDERLAPAVKPDILIRSYTRTGKAAEDKAALVARAAELRKQLDPRYARSVDASEADAIPYHRRYKSTDYVFLVNDRREFGTYVGQHGLVMENGVPTRATVSIRRRSGVVYDLLGRRGVSALPQGDALHLNNVDLGPCDGALFMITRQPIHAVRVTVPPEVGQGHSATCRVEVVDPQGQPVEAVVPVSVAVRDPEGRAAEFTGYFGMADGRLDIPLQIARNDLPGVWQIEAEERADGKTATAYFRVTPVTP